MPQVRNDTITLDAPESLLQTRNSGDDTPNDLLFALFLDSLQGLHDREIHLTDFECEHLLNLIKHRDRDISKHPLPFLVDEGTLENVDGDHDARSESTVSMTTSTSVTSASIASYSVQSAVMSGKGTQPQKTLKQVLNAQWQHSHSLASSQSQKQGITGSGTGTPIRLQSDEHQGDLDHGRPVLQQSDLDHMMRVTPRWRCFIKSVNTTHIMVTFVPATYDDLRILIQGQGIFRVQDAINKNKDPIVSEKNDLIENIDIDGVEHATASYMNVDGVEYALKVNKKSLSDQTESDRERHSSGASGVKEDSPRVIAKASQDVSDGISKETGRSEDTVKEIPGEVSQEDEDTEQLDTPLETVEDMSAEPECGECEDVPSGYSSFLMPVFVYNCPLSSLTQQLVNKWTYQKPVDIFQDLTFKSESHEQDVMSAMDQQSEHTDDNTTEHHNVGTETKRIRTDSDVREKLRFGREETILDSIYGQEEDLKQQCTLISEHFFRSFVFGEYK